MLKVIFLLMVFLSLLFLYYGTGKNKRLILLLTVWQVLIGALAFYQIFIENPKLFPIVIFGTVLLTIFGLNRIDASKLKPNFLLGIHILRISVELVLYQLYLQEKIPQLMTFYGWNFDIVLGISALIILVYQLILKRKINRTLFIIWNSIGIVFLLVIVSLAILSSPSLIQQFAFDQPNIAVLEFPYCFLPTCVVPIVLMSNILLIEKSTTANNVNEQ
ncbi:conserved hypothetical membrane protein [Formosa agariphila KMM 3901]|uniref:Conserved hypothetical membrane protein n=1 Tax=Formosa agariphila (strain DSM 15362 / KCTC 12365 / LMG 23005 / KMM 3901 / M-2Alg 35-1) TaxID=1347342 RepID=T2KQK7_FORAG|nr:hypothetical protein [Formosa agariphila]CDF80269.1 conserved hypothetical membrane protein [Formosa agariphila KMM 3901]